MPNVRVANLLSGERKVNLAPNIQNFALEFITNINQLLAENIKHVFYV